MTNPADQSDSAPTEVGDLKRVEGLTNVIFAKTVGYDWLVDYIDEPGDPIQVAIVFGVTTPEKALEEIRFSFEGFGEPKAAEIVGVRRADLAEPQTKPVSFQWRTVDGWVDHDERDYAVSMADRIGLGYRELYAGPPATAAPVTAPPQPLGYVSAAAVHHHLESGTSQTGVVIHREKGALNGEDDVPIFSAPPQPATDLVKVAITIGAEVRRRNRVGEDDEKGSISTSCELAATILVLKALRDGGFLVAPPQPAPHADLVERAPGHWSVEIIDHDDDGQCYITVFYGPNSKGRAEAYIAALSAVPRVEGTARELAEVVLSMTFINAPGQFAKKLALKVLDLPDPFRRSDDEVAITTNGTTRFIPRNEPVFLIRGQDVSGGDAVRAWAALAEAQGADFDMCQIAREHAAKMDAWPKKKLPDLPSAPTAAE